MVIASLENPATRQNTEKKNNDATNIIFRPNMSASLPKKSKNAPLLSELADEIQVISAVVMCNL